MNYKLKDFNYQIFGEDTSPKLVFLHGIMGRGKNWQSIAKNFSKDYQCLIYDQRGHGQSVQPESGYELKDYAQDLKNILDDLGWTGPIHLVGHSMGGRVSLMFATLFPELVEKLVVVDIGPTSNWDSMQSVFDKMDFVPVPFASRQEARTFMDTEFTNRYSSKMLAEFFYSNLVSKNDQYDWVFSKKA
ncbi:MAG: alpha/beta fold hydrolase, partial [Bdellovibrionales bacterium]|nr:alpha/beta fold hydrolase [Bdellovibrionales bacterium]NQZ20178.1 alpha/beta fold hydrolase [Bdellovibrionales bacterium]